MTPEEMKQRSRGISTDMSAEAIARRIDKVSQLRELGLALRKARIIPPTPIPSECTESSDPRTTP